VKLSEKNSRRDAETQRSQSCCKKVSIYFNYAMSNYNYFKDLRRFQSKTSAYSAIFAPPREMNRIDFLFIGIMEVPV